MAEAAAMNLQRLCYTALDDRQMLADLICVEGVANLGPSGSLLVTTGGSGLNLSVAQGGAFIQGDDDDDQGMYHVYNDGPTVLAATGAASPGPGSVLTGVPNADGSKPRIDQIIAHVYDSQYAGIEDKWVLEVLTGTPTTSADLSNLSGAWPTLPNDAIRLAYGLVPAGFTGPFVDATHILDARSSAKPCGAGGQKCELTPSGTPQPIASGSTSTITNWATPTIDSTYFSYAAGVITIKKAGYYDISAGSNADATAVQLAGVKLGSTSENIMQQSTGPAAGDTSSSMSMAREGILLAAGETISLFHYQADGGSRNWNPGSRTGQCEMYLTVALVELA